MKSAFKGVVFWIGQKDVEVQLSVNKALHFRQKCEQMEAAYSQKMSQAEEAYNAKLQQVHAGYQKAMKKIQAMEQERETTQKDKKEIQEKYTEKSRFLISSLTFHAINGSSHISKLFTHIRNLIAACLFFIFLCRKQLLVRLIVNEQT